MCCSALSYSWSFNLLITSVYRVSIERYRTVSNGIAQYRTVSHTLAKPTSCFFYSDSPISNGLTLADPSFCAKKKTCKHAQRKTSNLEKKIKKKKNPVLFFYSFHSLLIFAPSPTHSLTVTFLLALPPTQYEGRRLNEEVSEDEEGTVLYSLSLCVWSPCLSTRKQGGGFQMTDHQPPVPGGPWRVAPALPEPASPLPPVPPILSLVFLSWPVSLSLSADCIYIYIYIAFGLCVFKCPTGAKGPHGAVLSPNFPTCDAFYSGQQFAWGWIGTSCLTMHRFGEGRTAFPTEPPSRLCVRRAVRCCKETNDNE